MPISQETQDFAERLVATEEHMRRALKHAGGLFRDLVQWTASDDVQNKGKKPNGDPVDHIDMACHVQNLGKGVHHLTEAMAAICGSHVDLKKFCEDCKIDIPDFPTTRDGGGR